MPRRRNAAVLALALVLGMSLAGCVQQPAHVIPTSEPSSKPVFASDAAALAAAKKAFSTYLAETDSVGHDGGASVQQLSKLDTSAQYARDVKTFSSLQRAGEHTAGDSKFSTFKMQSSELAADSIQTVGVYVCMDISQTQLIDSAGDPVDVDRPSDVPLVLTFRGAKAGSKTLLVDRSVTWQGKNFCS